MNDTLDYKISVMQAYRAGEKIEHRNTKRARGGETEWFETSNPQWDWWNCEYRVKPQEPRKVWVNIYDITEQDRCYFAHTKKQDADTFANNARQECVEFIEVTPEIRKALGL